MTSARAGRDDDVVLTLGRDAFLRMRLPGRPQGQRAISRIGSLASAASRFSIGISRPVKTRRALRGPEPVRVNSLRDVDPVPPRWWQPGLIAEPTPAVVPRRTLPRAVHRVPDDKSWTPGGIVGGLAPEVVPVRRLSEVAAAGPMLTSHDTQKLTATRARSNAVTAPPPPPPPPPTRPRSRAVTERPASLPAPRAEPEPARAPSWTSARRSAPEKPRPPVSRRPLITFHSPKTKTKSPAVATTGFAALGGTMFSLLTGSHPTLRRAMNTGFTVNVPTRSSLAPKPVAVPRPEPEPAALRTATRIGAARAKQPATPKPAATRPAGPRIGAARAKKPATPKPAAWVAPTRSRHRATASARRPGALARRTRPSSTASRLAAITATAAATAVVLTRPRSGALMSGSVRPLALASRPVPPAPVTRPRSNAVLRSPTAPTRPRRNALVAVPVRPALSVTTLAPAAPKGTWARFEARAALTAASAVTLVGRTRRDLTAASRRTRESARPELAVVRPAGRALSRPGLLATAFATAVAIRPSTVDAPRPAEQQPADTRSAGPGAPGQPAARTAGQSFVAGASSAFRSLHSAGTRLYGATNRAANRGIGISATSSGLSARLTPSPPRLSVRPADESRSAAAAARAATVPPPGTRAGGWGLVPGPDGRMRPSLVDSTAALFAAAAVAATTRHQHGGRDVTSDLTEHHAGLPAVPGVAHPAVRPLEPRSILDDAAAMTELVDEVVERIEARVVDELERRGRRYTPGVF